VSECTDNENTWSLAKKWITNCIKYHPECYPNNRSQKWYPSRLLDVGSSSGEIIKLHDTREQETLGDYMTVSHRWGDIKPMSLTQESAPHLKAGIRIVELPKTFADAVKIAQKMSIKYLWIDSLCIYQDSESEWRAESAKMGLVYKNSWLNIAAMDSSDCTGGCFFRRDKRLVDLIKVELGDDGKEYLCIDSNLWLVGIDEAPLSRRGWILQERLLSPRQIHFGELQIYWECRRQAACETLPGGILPSMFARPGTAASQQLKRFAATLSRFSYDTRASYSEKNHGASSTEGFDSQNAPNTTPLDIYTGWRHSVQNYSKCRLTYSRDKLIAISGVAKEMSKVINDQYLAGLWRSQLPTTLLWSAEPSGSASSFRNQRWPTGTRKVWTRQRPLRAPTWSWASLDTPISFFFPVTTRERDKVTVNVLEAHIEPLAGDIHGEVLNGFIRVRCPLYPASLIFETEKSQLTPSLCIGNSVFQDGIFLDESPDLVGTGSNLHCMPIFFRDWSGTQTAPKQVRALILQPSGKGRGHFERFGLFMSWGNRGLDIFRMPWESETNLEYEEALGGGEYIITIT
jgi:heterokaryon incompatibility protein (HET)